MILPKRENVYRETHRRFYNYDSIEYFSSNKKSIESVYYISRINEIINIVEKSIPLKGTILDIGCAQGNIPLILAEKGYNVVGVDYISDGLSYAFLKYERGNCNFVAGDAEKLPFKSKFNCIIISEFLEHVNKPELFLNVFNNFLEENGILIITTPNGSSILNTKVPNYTYFKLNNDCKKIGPEKKDHVFNFNMFEIKNLLKESKFEIIENRYINSYLLNPVSYFIYKNLPIDVVYKFNSYFSNIPIFKKYLCSTILFAAKRKKF